MAQRVQPLVRTVHDLDLLPEDGNRYELIDGVLFVSAAPLVRHQLAQSALGERLMPYVRRLGMHVLFAPTAVRASAWTEVQPDILVVERVDVEPMARHLAMPTLALAVEILSPSTADRDRGLKRQTYLAHGVGEYWVVDLDARVIDVWRALATPVKRCDTTLVWSPSQAAAPLVLDIADYFNAVGAAD